MVRAAGCPSGIVNLQPSELMKLFAVLYAADYTARKMPLHARSEKGLSATGERDGRRGHPVCSRNLTFGAFVVIISIAMGILFLGGMKARLFVVLIIVLAVPLSPR
jgi:cell division protein FtsW